MLLDGLILNSGGEFPTYHLNSALYRMPAPCPPVTCAHMGGLSGGLGAWILYLMGQRGGTSGMAYQGGTKYPLSKKRLK